MKIGSDNVFGVTAQNAPNLRLGVTWAPSATRQTWVAQGSGHYVGLVAGTRAPDAAWRYVEFLATPAANQIILDVIGWVVYNKEVARALDVSKLPGLR
jgi:ABC-type glycerol-3-phosphate transport system substrate-binding protein